MYFGELTRGKIVYKGDLFYKTTTLLENAELSEDKFIHSHEYPTDKNFLYNGTQLNLEDVNQFKTRTYLLYFHDFGIKELQWDKSPGFSYYTGSSDFIYLSTTESIDSYIESPVITYLGTEADLAILSYRYQLYYSEVLSNDIWVDLESQLWRDGEMVYQQCEYRGFYDGIGSNWKTTELNVTEYFQEGGQQFQIKILANFSINSLPVKDMSIRYDYVRLEVWHPPVYFKDFKFYNGFNEFTSPITQTTESIYYDLDKQLSEVQINAIPNGSSSNSFGI